MTESKKKPLTPEEIAIKTKILKYRILRMERDYEVSVSRKSRSDLPGEIAEEIKKVVKQS